MDIDFIKWMVGYADGFEMKRDFISVISPDALWDTEILLNDEILLPFLVVKTLDGINNCNKKWEIRQNRNYISLYYEHVCKISYKLKSADQAKEQALKYIYEQEK